MSSRNSLAPRGSRLPWPTMSSAGSPAPLTFFPLAASGRSFKSFLPEVQERVQRRRRDRGSALGPVVRRGWQPALGQPLLRLCGAHEPDREPDDERRPGVQLQQLEECRRRIPNYPDGAEARLFLREPDPSCGASYVQVLGEQLCALVRDEAKGLARRDARGDHRHVSDNGGAPAQGFQTAFQGLLVQDEALGVLEIGGGVDHAL